MPYLPSFDTIRQSMVVSTVKGQLQVDMAYDDFMALLRKLLEGVNVDEAWYLGRYADINDGIERGAVRSAVQHFVGDGFLEGRMPFPIQVDETWYLAQNPDVAASIQRGDFANAQEHFEKDGYREGRRPFARG